MPKARKGVKFIGHKFRRPAGEPDVPRDLPPDARARLPKLEPEPPDKSSPFRKRR